MRLPAATAAASMSASSVPNTYKYEVSADDTITHIALQHNTTPAELSRLNHLSTSLLYPGQTLLVPSPELRHEYVAEHGSEADAKVSEDEYRSSSNVFDREKMVFSPDRNLDRLLNNTSLLNASGDEISRKYLKVSKSKYVTDGHGVVTGVLLVTPQTVMFNPSVSDHLVMEHGQEMYVVRLPLRAIAKVVVFEDIAAMVVGDTSKQYTPKVNFTEFTTDQSFSPKPGHVVCQETGKPFALHTPRQHSVDSHDEPPALNMMGDMDLTVTVDPAPSTVDDITMTSTSSDLLPIAISQDEDPLAATTGDSDDVSAFMQDTQLCSTPRHDLRHTEAEHEPSHDNPQGNQDNGELTTESMDSSSIDNGVDPGHAALPVCDENSVSDVIQECEKDTENASEVLGELLIQCTPADTVLTSEKKPDVSINSDTSDIVIDESHFDLTPELGLDVVTADVSHKSVSQADNRDEEVCENTPGPLTSEMIAPTQRTTRQDSDDSKEASTTSTGSSLTDEARQWLGERGVRLPSDSEPSVSPHQHQQQPEVIKEVDVTPRLASIGDDPLMYVALKVHRTYFCPIRAKQNQIMGIPPNRDEKRREHWLAVPREKVDQVYNFLLYWSPDLYGGEDSSACSTPCSTSECENPEDSKPASRLDVPSMSSVLSKSKSLYSIDSKASTCSLGYDELPDLQAETQLLTSKQVQLLTRRLPSRTVGHSWELLYSTTIHGISLGTLYRNCHGCDSPVLLVVQDENKKVFGAFVSEPPKVSDGFYGTGESMLFTFPSETKLKTFNWTGDNQFFVKGSKTSFVIGGGEGVFGLWLDEDLYYGRSHSCKTFGNDMLSSSEDFICCGLEAWAFV